MRLAEATLDQRAKAARELVRWGRLDGDLALSYVIWPDITPNDLRDVFRMQTSVSEPARCRAATRTAIFPTRCSYRVVEDGLCGRHLRLRREGKSLMYYQEG